MKTLTNPQITVEGDKVTIVCQVKDLKLNRMLVTRVSHGHINPENARHPRRIQSSSEAVFIESPSGKLAIPNMVIAAIAAHAAPETSFPPVFQSDSTPNSVKVASETPVALQWQVSDNPAPIAEKPDTAPPAAVWADIAGATGESLEENLVKPKQWIRCVATNLAGKTISKPVQKA